MIRVIYELEVAPGKRAQLERAWRRIVRAHRRDGALGSVLLRDEEVPGRLVAISRWQSREHWERGRTDEADPDAYAEFRDACEVLSRRALLEIDALE